MTIRLSALMLLLAACQSPSSGGTSPDTTDTRGETGPDDVTEGETVGDVAIDVTEDTLAPDSAEDTSVSTDTAEVSPPTDTADTADTNDTPDTNDTGDTAETVDTTDTVDTNEGPDAETTPSCTDECGSAGASVCDGAAAFRGCGLFDDDACLDLGPSIDCGDFEACTDGQCISTCPGANCTAPGQTSCGGASTERLCVIDTATGCPELGPTATCQSGNVCDQGSCDGGCTIPELVILVDRSSSMTGARWTLVKAGITAFLAARNQHARVGLRFFPSAASCSPDAASPLALGTTFAAGINPVTNDSAPIADALTGLLPTFGSATQAELVVLITDGTETCKTADAVNTAVTDLRRRGVDVHTIGIGDSFDAALLDGIAERGGTGPDGSIAVADANALQAALDNIIDGASACELPANPAYRVSCVTGLCVEECLDDTLRTVTGTCVLPEVSSFPLTAVTSLRAIAFGSAIELMVRSDNRLRHVAFNPQPTVTSLGLNIEVKETWQTNDRWVTYVDKGLVTRRAPGIFTGTSLSSWFDLRQATMRPNGELLLVENNSAGTTIYKVIDEIGGTLTPTGALNALEQVTVSDSFEPTNLGGISHVVVGPDDVLNIAYRPVNSQTHRIARLDADTMVRLGTSDPIDVTTIADIATGLDGTVHVVSTDARYIAVGPSATLLETIPRGVGVLTSPQLFVLRDGRPVVLGTSATGGLYLAVRQPGGWVDYGLIDSTAKAGVVDAVVTADDALHIFYATTNDQIAHRRYPGMDTTCVPNCAGRTCGNDGCGGTCGPSCGTLGCGDLECLPAVVINELKVETSSTVHDGYLELFVPVGTDLSRYALISINLSGALLQVLSLEGLGTGFVTLAGSNVRLPGNASYRVYHDHVLVDALALGGSTGIWGEGGARPASVAAGAVIGRIPDRSDTNVNTIDFRLLAAPSPGAPNN